MKAQHGTTPEPNPRHAGGYVHALRWIGAIGILAIAIMRCAIVFLPQLVFDTDPVGDTIAPAALGMGGSLLLDALLILACLFALSGERRHAGLDPLLLLLALLPLPIVIRHGSNDAGDLWRGSTLLAAAIACAAVAHLARDRTFRIIITAALIAVTVPLLARGATQMTWEHDATVAEYRANKAAILQYRGWVEDSPAVRIYERRLMHREPIGWFSSTNIYGSVMGCAAVMLAGLALIAWRVRMQSGWWFLMLLLSAACAVALWFTTSMGAILATIAGLFTMGVTMWLLTRPQQRMGLVGALLIVLIVGATLGVIVRGVVLPEAFIGEKSLLFRWHYLQAAVGIVSDHPLTGVGPDGFQPAYTAHRPARNPEEVQSAHAMFTDWLTMLGVSGGAWVALVITLVVRTGPALARVAIQTQASRLAWRAVITISALSLIPAMLIERPALTEVDLFLRILSMLGFAVITMMLAMLLARADERWLRAIAAAGAAVLLVHGQIEMTFFQGGSAVWAMCMLGLLGDAKVARTRWMSNLSGILVFIVLLATAIWIAVRGGLPALRQEQAMLDATRLLGPVREQPANDEVVLPQRSRTTEELLKAYGLWPINERPVNAAVDQLMFATTRPDQPPPVGFLLRAAEIIDRAVIDHDKPASIVLAMNVHVALASVTGDEAEWARAIALGQRMTNIDPHGVSAWQRLGDVLWAAGARQEAAQAYRIALANSDNFALDEMKQLSAAKRAAMQARIAEVDALPAAATAGEGARR